MSQNTTSFVIKLKPNLKNYTTPLSFVIQQAGNPAANFRRSSTPRKSPILIINTTSSHFLQKITIHSNSTHILHLQFENRTPKRKYFQFTCPKNLHPLVSTKVLNQVLDSQLCRYAEGSRGCIWRKEVQHHTPINTKLKLSTNTFSILIYSSRAYPYTYTHPYVHLLRHRLECLL